MTFCVSHQKQPDNDPMSSDANKLETSDAIKDDVTRSRETESVRSTESTNLGEQETKFY